MKMAANSYLQIQTPFQLAARAATHPSKPKASSISFKTLCTTNISTATASASDAVVADRLNNHASPWLMLAPEVDDTTGEKVERFYSLADGKTVRLNRKNSLKVPDTALCFASTRGSWLGYADTIDGSLYLSNPFLNEVVELPSLGTLPRVVSVERDPNSGSIINYKVAFPDYKTSWDNTSCTDADCFSLVDPVHMASMISNLALSFDHPRYPDCVAMAIQGEMSRVAYTHIGRKFHPTYCDLSGGCTMNDGTFWTGLQEDYFTGCIASDQVAYSSKNKMFYSLFDDAGIEAFDVERDRGRRSKKVSQFKMEQLYEQLEHEFFEDEQGSEALKEVRGMCEVQYYLATLENGDLLLIVRHYIKERCESDNHTPHYKTLHFDVFRVSYPGRLERVSCLEDRAIFIGRNQSFCIKAGASPGVRPNCIYFTDDLVRIVSGTKTWGHDNGIFSMNDGVISPCYPYNDEEEEKKVPFSAPLYWVAPVSIILSGFLREIGVCSEEHCIEG